MYFLNKKSEEILDLIIKNEYELDYERYLFEKDYLLSRNNIDEANKNKAQLNQFGFPVEHIPEYISLVIGVINIIIEIRKLKRNKKIDNKEVKVIIDIELNKSNVSKKVKNKIVEDYADDLLLSLNDENNTDE